MRAPAFALTAAVALVAATAGAQPAAAPDYAAPPPPYYPTPYPYGAPPGAVVPPMQFAYKDGDPIPVGYAVRARASRSLTIGGAITFGSPYLISILAAATVVSSNPTDGPGFTPLFIPVVGPFVSIVTSHNTGAATYWLLVDGLAQASGAAMFAAGWVLTDRYLQRVRTPAASATPEVLVGAGSTTLRWRF